MADRRSVIGQQCAFFLQGAEINGIRHQQHIGLYATAHLLGTQNVHQLRGAVACPGDVNIGLSLLKGINGLLGNFGRLRGINHQLTRRSISGLSRNNEAECSRAQQGDNGVTSLRHGQVILTQR